MATAQTNLFNSDIETGIDNTLQSIIIDVVTAICSQDCSNRGAWSFVVCRRISMDYGYFEKDIATAINQMLREDVLFESFRETWDNMLTMVYVKTATGGENKHIYRNREKYIMHKHMFLISAT